MAHSRIKYCIGAYTVFGRIKGARDQSSRLSYQKQHVVGRAHRET